MPIINQVVKGGGTGSFVGIPKDVDANGVLRNSATLIDLTGVTDFGNYSLQYAYYNNMDIPSTFSINTERITGLNAFTYAFASSCSLTTINANKLVYAGASVFSDMCRSNSRFTTFNCPSLKILGATTGAVFSNTFRATSVTSFSFPALKNVGNTGVFSNMLISITGCTIHFPSNMQSTIETMAGYPNFGGTDTIVLFDLPATVILTGANSVNYERSPKDDTATALAWRKQDTGTAPYLVIDWTPFYTSGLTDPTVGTTIYSDDACTTAVTTVDSIA